MRVLIVSAVYPPELVVSSQTSAQIAEALQQQGAEVTVVTDFPNRPAGKLYPGVSRRLYQRRHITDNLQIVRCFTTLSPESRMLSRFMENASFGVTSGWVVLTAPRPDVIYANSWPIIATGLLALIARLRRIPLVMSVQDVYPESLISQRRAGITTWLVRIMQQIDMAIARSCQALVVISPEFARLYQNNRRVQPERIHYVPNWLDSRSIVVDEQSVNSFRKQLGVPQEATLVVYGGNIGMAAGVETLLAGFAALADCDSLYLVVAGEGSRLAACRKLASDLNNPRVRFHSPWLKDETSTLLSAADVLVLPTRGRQSLVSMPSKLITYMLAARPVIAMAIAGSDSAVVVTESGCGWVIEPDQPQQLATKLREFNSLAMVERHQRGQAGRAYALQHFTAAVCVPQIMQIIEKAVLCPKRVQA